MIQEFLICFSILIVYFVTCVFLALLLRCFIKIPSEIFRKALHLMLLCSIFVLVYAFPTWWLSALAAVLFILVVYPILMAGERIKGYAEMLTERKKGELKRSLVVAFGMFAVIISLCWGLLGDRWLVLACIFAWGFGDGAAALVGKRFGRHFLQGKLIEGRKSLEGSLAMFFVSFASVIIILLLRGGLPWYGYIVTAVLTAATCTAVELYTRGGFDTVTCPVAAAAVILPLLWLLGGVAV